ncbi:LytTR family DNA-binding domain-containing protein [Methanobrevibacter olleyae]|uniref:LytTr DNA-binding domain-containing protein n=1 Tax=Methanobrevibacter olleyae TaxID=294671 RepID=A0A126QYU9_METOL|nr:LytTR family DNA-binding domain-containing protein [Methanobrevibacter olleyae]AMK14859.1 LytTr DNA-binding domain-containing protein [Methanobrevibacter olleyae]
MKVELFVSKDLEEPYAKIYTDVLTDNIQKAMALLEDNENVRENEERINENNSILAVKKGQNIVLLDFEDIFMIRVEDKQTKVFTEDMDYLVKKPLYQIEENLDSNFVRVSKSTIVNLRKIKRVAPSLKGMMFIELKNGLKDNISRKYLHDFKNALNL